MSEPYVSQLLTVSFSWAPKNWALCNGQLFLVRQNQALYALLGTQFGGSAGVNFNVPNCAGRTIVGSGTDMWNNTYPVGMGPSDPVSIGVAQLPPHTHTASYTPAGPSSVTLTGSINQPLSAPLGGGLEARSTGAADNTPNDNDVIGPATSKVYAPSSGGAAVPLATLPLQGTLTGTLSPMVTATATVPPAAGTVALQATGSASNVPLTAPYLVQTVIIATTGLFPMRQ